MLLYPIKTPMWIQKMWPNIIWRKLHANQKIHLTFDDGPTPEITPWVLDWLGTNDYKATFFCIGKNVLRYPQIYERILAEGHAVGNHTFNHVNGWKTPLKTYLEEVEKTAQLISSNLFRPPYGRLSLRQYQALKKHYKIVLWDILSGDFDPKCSKEQCLANVSKNVKAGSIIVFHDSKKASEKLKWVLTHLDLSI